MKLVKRFFPIAAVVFGQETTTENDDASDDNGNVATVSCMNGDFVEMTASINESDVQNDLTQEGWTLDNGVYAKTWMVADFSDEEKSVDEQNNLVLTKSQITACEQATYGEETVCLNVGMELNFRCKYALDDLTLSSDIAVSGQDDDFENQGEGELIYTMEADSSVQIGQPVSVTITPKNPGLVYASIQHCKVKYNNYEMPLMVGSSGESGTYNLKPVCVFGTEIPNSSNMQTLDFSWTAFKWSSAASDSFTENQKVECTVKLTKDQPAHTTANCDEPSTPAPPTEAPTTVDPEQPYQHQICKDLELVSQTSFTHVTGCAPGWEEGEILGVKKCFKFGGGGTSLDGMEKCCQQGGFLPSPKNSLEAIDYYSVFAATTWTDNNGSVHYGALDIRKVNNGWQNSLGETLIINSYASDKLQWHTGFPKGNQKCTTFHGSDRLSTRDCDQDYGLVCETDFF